MPAKVGVGGPWREGPGNGGAAGGHVAEGVYVWQRPFLRDNTLRRRADEMRRTCIGEGNGHVRPVQSRMDVCPKKGTKKKKSDHALIPERAYEWIAPDRVIRATPQIEADLGQPPHGVSAGFDFAPDARAYSSLAWRFRAGAQPRGTRSTGGKVPRAPRT